MTFDRALKENYFRVAARNKGNVSQSLLNCSLYNQHVNLTYDVIAFEPTLAVTDELVTLVTQLTPNRFESVERMAQNWRGPMSVAFYVTSSELSMCQSRVREWIQRTSKRNVAVLFMLQQGVSTRF